MGGPATTGTGQPGGWAPAWLRDHPGCRADHGCAPFGGDAVRGDLTAGGPGPDRADDAGRAPPALPDHRDRGRGTGTADRADAPDGRPGEHKAEHPDRDGWGMSGHQSAPDQQPGAPSHFPPRATAPPPPFHPLLARAALALYPPAWRARYGQEALELLCDLGGGMPAAASMAWRAVPAWLWPPRHLHDRAGRMRASMATA